MFTFSHNLSLCIVCNIAQKNIWMQSLQICQGNYEKINCEQIIGFNMSVICHVKTLIIWERKWGKKDLWHCKYVFCWRKQKTFLQHYVMLISLPFCWDASNWQWNQFNERKSVSKTEKYQGSIWWPLSITLTRFNHSNAVQDSIMNVTWGGGQKQATKVSCIMSMAPYSYCNILIT